MQRLLQRLQYQSNFKGKWILNDSHAFSRLNMPEPTPISQATQAMLFRTIGGSLETLGLVTDVVKLAPLT